GGDRQVPFVLAILVVYNDDLAAGANDREGLFDRGKWSVVACPLRDPKCRRGPAVGGRGQFRPASRSGHGSEGLVWRAARSAARTAYLPSTSYSRFTLSPTASAARF